MKLYQRLITGLSKSEIPTELLTESVLGQLQTLLPECSPAMNHGDISFPVVNPTTFEIRLKMTDTGLNVFRPDECASTYTADDNTYDDKGECTNHHFVSMTEFGSTRFTNNDVQRLFPCGRGDDTGPHCPLQTRASLKDTIAEGKFETYFATDTAAYEACDTAATFSNNRFWKTGDTWEEAGDTEQRCMRMFDYVSKYGLIAVTCILWAIIVIFTVHAIVHKKAGGDLAGFDIMTEVAYGLLYAGLLAASLRYIIFTQRFFGHTADKDTSAECFGHYMQNIGYVWSGDSSHPNKHSYHYLWTWTVVAFAGYGLAVQIIMAFAAVAGYSSEVIELARGITQKRSETGAFY